MISADGSRVLHRDDPEIHTVILSNLKNAEKVEIVSTGSRYSLIVRVSLVAGLFRDDLIGEDGKLMRGERWLPTTGKLIRELILKFILVSSTMKEYTYDTVNDKCTMLQPDVINECVQQRDAFDATNQHVPLCPDFVAFIPFLTREAFDNIFNTPKNKHYADCRVFSKLRTYFSIAFKPQVAMIVMESIPASYVPLKQIYKLPDAINPALIQQVCAMYVVLFHMCKMVALDAHWSNWLVDASKPPPLGVKLIDFGMCLSTFDTNKIKEIVRTYFERHSTELPAYLRLMGASPGDSPDEVMVKAIMSVRVLDGRMEPWIHKILVISMLIDGFFNMNHSTKKTCQMKHAFNVVYNDACKTMSNILETLSLDLQTYLASQSEDKSQHVSAMLRNMAAYMTTYYGLGPRTWDLHADDAPAPAPAPESMDQGAALSSYSVRVLHDSHGGKKTNNTRKRNSTKRKRNKKNSSKSRKNKMHRK